MGIKERRLVHKENLKNQIISAARTIFKEEGSQQYAQIVDIAVSYERMSGVK